MRYKLPSVAPPEFVTSIPQSLLEKEQKVLTYFNRRNF